jgi:hypothetical protein
MASAPSLNAHGCNAGLPMKFFRIEASQIDRSIDGVIQMTLAADMG